MLLDYIYNSNRIGKVLIVLVLMVKKSVFLVYMIYMYGSVLILSSTILFVVL